MPSEKKINLDNELKKYTAPCDGYLLISILGRGFIQLHKHNYSPWICYKIDAGLINTIYLPLAKGNNALIEYADGMEVKALQFHPAQSVESEVNK